MKHYEIKEKIDAQYKREREISSQSWEAYIYAVSLASILAAKHFPENTEWKPLPDLTGVLTQIDNMTSSLIRNPNDIDERFL